MNTSSITEPESAFAFDAWVCTNCYDQHHNRPLDLEAMRTERRSPADLLKYLSDCRIHDHTDSNTGEGIDNYSSSECNGCRTNTAGSRYRLHCITHND